LYQILYLQICKMALLLNQKSMAYPW
jgi:hypothetical protein